MPRYRRLGSGGSGPRRTLAWRRIASISGGSGTTSSGPASPTMVGPVVIPPSANRGRPPVFRSTWVRKPEGEAMPMLGTVLPAAAMAGMPLPMLSDRTAVSNQRAFEFCFVAAVLSTVVVTGSCVPAPTPRRMPPIPLSPLCPWINGCRKVAIVPPRPSVIGLSAASRTVLPSWRGKSPGLVKSVWNRPEAVPLISSVCLCSSSNCLSCASSIASAASFSTSRFSSACATNLSEPFSSLSMRSCSMPASSTASPMRT